MECQPQATPSWTTRRDEKKRRMQLVSSWMNGPVLAQAEGGCSLGAPDRTGGSNCAGGR